MNSPILEIRKKLGVTQKTLAQALSCSQGQISDIERGYDILNDSIVKSLGSLMFDEITIAKEQKKFVKLTKKDALLFIKEMRKNEIQNKD